MDAGDYDIEITRGRERTWCAQLFQNSPPTLTVDLTGCTVVAGIKLPDGTKIALAAEVVDGEVDGEMVTPQDGWIRFSITPEESALLTGTLYPWGAGVIDAQDDWNPALAGSAHVTADPTPNE